MALRFYADESEDKGHKVLAIGGFLGEADEWERLQEEWIARVKPTGVSAYHMTDCESGFGEFAAWPRADRDQLTIDLIGIIARHEVLMFGSGLLLDDYKQIPPVDGRGTRLGKDKWHLVFQQMLYNVARYVDERAPNSGAVSFFFDWKEKSGRAKQIFDVFRLDERLKQWRKRLGSLTFGYKEFDVPGSLPLLQVADIAAVETRKSIGNPITHPHLPERRSLIALKSADRVQRIDYLNKEILTVVHRLKIEEIGLS